MFRRYTGSRTWSDDPRWWAGHWVWQCSGSEVDTLQTPDESFPPAQSGGVWKVDGTVVVDSDPEQGGQRSVVKHH